MSLFLKILILNIVLFGVFQNCAKNQAIRFESMGTEETEGQLTPEQAQSIPNYMDYKHCLLPDGKPAPSFYWNWGVNVTQGSTCGALELRQCFDGNMNAPTPGYDKTNCQVAALPSTATQKPCQLAGQSIPHGHIVTAFNAALVTGANNCFAEFRRCVDGTLMGKPEFFHLTCRESHYKPGNNEPKDCAFNGIPIPDGSSIISFEKLTPSGNSGEENCSFQPRRCIQGALSGHVDVTKAPYTHLTCLPPATK